MIREELNEKKDQLRQKELQLTSFGRTLQELEDTTRWVQRLSSYFAVTHGILVSF